MKEKKESAIRMELKLRKRHPHKSFRLGRHVVGVQFAEFDLNEAEAKELDNAGCKIWLISKKELEAAKKKKERKKEAE